MDEITGRLPEAVVEQIGRYKKEYGRACRNSFREMVALIDHEAWAYINALKDMGAIGPKERAQLHDYITEAQR